MRRRELVTTAIASTAALAAPRIARSQSARLLRFVPASDLASVDPVWTTADITRNYSLAVFDTLYGTDVKFNIQPQMVAGHVVENDGRLWRLTLRDGLKFHDGTPVLARDCVATIRRYSVRDPLGAVLAARTEELSVPSDKVIEFRLSRPFALLPMALARYTSAIMPERLAATDPMKQIPEVIGSGPFRFKADERVPGARVVFVRNPDYVPRPDGVPSFTAGPKMVHFDRVEWTVMPDPATAEAALMNNEIDWWENPTIDLVGTIRRNPKLTVRVIDVTGEIGCLRFNHLYPPFDNVEIRRIVLRAIRQRDVMEAVAGAEPSLIKTDIGVFFPATPYASDVGVEVTRGDADSEKLKRELIAAGYKGERVVVLGATTNPAIFAEAEVASDVLQRIGFNVDFQALEWGTVVQRRASMEPVSKGGWSIFYTYLDGSNVAPPTMTAPRGSGKKAYFGWSTSERMETLRDAWFDAPDLAAQQKITRAMQEEFWNFVPYVPLGMYDVPTAYWNYLTDMRDGYPQFYGVRKV
jgi:peptide/nickel transport system substrate-binding protein